MKRYNLFFLLILSFILIINSTLYSQRSRKRKQLTDNRQFVNYWLTTPISADTLLYTHYAKISNDFLQFVFDDSIYLAKYELSLQVLSDADEIYNGKIIRNTIKADSYKETNNIHQYAIEVISLKLPVDNYTIFLELNDLETKEPYQHKYPISLTKAYQKSIELYGFRYFRENMPSNENMTNIFPTFPAIRSPEDSTFRAGFFLYNKNLEQPFHLTYNIFNKQGISIAYDSLYITPNETLQPIILELTQLIKFGQYRLALNINNTIDSIQKSSFFFVQWDKHPLSIQSLSDAIEAMIYVMPPRQYKELKNQLESEQKETFAKYWKERDPTPATEENELEHEFFNRVSVANQKFSSFKEGRQGWKTDRGRIYIVYGPPSDYERPTQEPGSMVQYEIWYYRNLHKRFIFVDRYGTNEYRLISET